MLKQGAEQDIQREKPVIERKHEWAHGSEGRGRHCPRSDRPVFTDPTTAPGTCRDWVCDNSEWRSKGIVLRDKRTRQIVRREPA